MASRDLENQVVAVLATHGFEYSELDRPVRALKDAGATVRIIAPEAGSIRGWDGGDWGDSYDVDLTVAEAMERPETFDALLLPGGVMNPDKLRMDEQAVAFTRKFFEVGKPVSAICHGPQMLIECDVVDRREITSYPSLRKDLENAGARWVDREVVVDQGLTTSRTPDDLDAFIKKTIEEIKEGKHAGQRTA